MKAHHIGTVVTLTQGVIYTCPSDGYVIASCDYGASNYCGVSIYADDSTVAFNIVAISNSGANGNQNIFVKKGTKVKFGSGVGNPKAYFYPIIE